MATRTEERARRAGSDRGRWVNRLFLAHPRAVGETYGQHAVIAGRFGLAMIAGGLRCLIHAVVPCVQQRSASETVRRLHRELAERQRSGEVDPDFVI